MHLTQENISIQSDKIKTSLEAVCQSRAFANSGQLCTILRYLVDETLAGNGDALKAYSIGVDALGRRSDFDPAADSIVRAQLHRLRTKLLSYYAQEGKDDAIRIEIPLGHYRPKFISKEGQTVAPTPEAEILSHWRPAILIKPLVNQTPENGYTWFSEGLSERLAVGLSNFQDIDVISYYSGKLHNQGLLAEPHPARVFRFILEGSYQTLGSLMRINIKLTDCKQGKILWADSMVLELSGDNGFLLEDKILHNVLSFIATDHGLISQHLFRESRGTDPDNLEIYEAVLRYYNFTRNLDTASRTDALIALERCLTRYKFCPALVYAALAELYIADYKMAADLIPDALNKAQYMVDKALELDYNLQLAHLSMANLCFVHRDKAMLDVYIENVIKLNPNNYPSVSIALDWLGRSGDLEEACARLQALYANLNAILPYHHYTSFFLQSYLQGKYEQAISYLYNPGHATSHEINDYYGVITNHQLGNLAGVQKYVENIKKHLQDRKGKMRRVFRNISFFDQVTEEFVEILKLYGLD